MTGRRPLGFQQRLDRRAERWWGTPFRWMSWRSYAETPHRVFERMTWRSSSDPDERWRCCDVWPRTLINKWNGREYAVRHGCRVPELYWHGRWPWQIPFERLPAQYVIRPAYGFAKRGIFVVADGCERLRDAPITPAEIRRRLVRERAIDQWGRLLAEEFVTDARGQHQCPVEAKCYTFGDTVAAIQVIDRAASRARMAPDRYYTADWRPFDQTLDATRDVGPLLPPPACLEEMVSAATRIGRTLGTFMRIDFFVSDKGAVFNEFSSMPYIVPTPYCDALFGDLWEAKFPSA
jgi:hypothetical protein